jgi:hypothetical protein
MLSHSQTLNARQRFIFLMLNLGAGLLPSLAFFSWVERNASLPWVSLQMGWPWVSIQDLPIPVLATWDLLLFFIFGFLHSLTAQPFIHKWIHRFVPDQGLRTVYLTLTGLSLLVMMGLWQNTGTIVWALPLPVQMAYAVSLLLFWSCMAACGWIVQGFDPLEFVGLRQIYMSNSDLMRTSGMPLLKTSGVYGWVRHPIYSFTLLAFLLTPVMSLDRLLLTAATTVYLIFAIPLEERKLIGIFGSAYEDYRRKVPAVIPQLIEWPKKSKLDS